MDWPIGERHWVFPAYLDRVVDGDTYDMMLDLGFRTYKQARCKLAGIDTAEVYGTTKESEEYKRGIKQIRHVRDWFEKVDGTGWPLLVSTQKDTGKYGRWIASIRTREDNPSYLADWILKEYPDVYVPKE